MMHLTHVLHCAANSTPNAMSTTCDDRIRTWSETRIRVARLAAALRGLGVAAGDRVAILSLNSDRYTEFNFAVWWAGAVVVPMNVRWSAAEIAYSLNDSGTEVLFVDSAFAAMLPAIETTAQSLTTLIYVDDGPLPIGMLNYEALIETNAPCADANAGDEDLAGLYYTGGTTGFPKGVMIAHRALWYNNMAVSKALNLTADDVVLHVAPMFHMADICLGGAASLVGAAHASVPKFDPERVLEAVESHGVTHTVMVPTMIGMMLRHPAFNCERLKSLRYLGYGGSPMPQGILADALRMIPHVSLVQIYGQTEMAPLVTVLPADYHVLEGSKSTKLRSAGRAAPGCEVRIVDDEGRDLPAGEVGEIVARSPGCMTGYWKQPEQTAATLRDGWVHTGDGAYRDEDGFIFIVDRLKDMIVTGGENVFSAEVESAISTHPCVAEVAVVGIPSEQWGEAVHAIVVPRAGAEVSADDVIKHCEPLIANYKRPRSVTIRAEPLPLSGAGKVLKRDLRAPYWENRVRSVN